MGQHGHWLPGKSDRRRQDPALCEIRTRLPGRSLSAAYRLRHRNGLPERRRRVASRRIQSCSFGSHAPQGIHVQARLRGRVRGPRGYTEGLLVTAKLTPRKHHQPPRHPSPAAFYFHEKIYPPFGGYIRQFVSGILYAPIVIGGDDHLSGPLIARGLKRHSPTFTSEHDLAPSKDLAVSPPLSYPYRGVGPSSLG